MKCQASPLAHEHSALQRAHVCLQCIDSWLSWHSNPLYAILHESIYCQGAASRWAAEAVRQEAPSRNLFDAVSRVTAGLPVYFTG